MRRAVIASALCMSLGTGVMAQTTDPNPALNHPDQISWELFVTVNKPAGVPNRTDVVFETWASNEDTFQANPQFPGSSAPPSCGRPSVVAGLPQPLPLAVPLGGKPLGFINPLLYQQPRLLKSVTVGNNNGPFFNIGYQAGPDPDWNACTGLGTPIGAEIVRTLMAIA